MAHSRDVHVGIPDVSITQADLRVPAEVLGASGVAGLLDFSRPVAVLAVAALHYVSPADDLPAVVAAYRDALAPGSAFAMSYGSDHVDDPVAAAHMRDLADVTAGSANSAYMRSRAELTEALAGFDLLELGLVDIRRWRTHSELPDATVYEALGVLRGPAEQPSIGVGAQLARPKERGRVIWGDLRSRDRCVTAALEMALVLQRKGSEAHGSTAVFILVDERQDPQRDPVDGAP